MARKKSNTQSSVDVIFSGRPFRRRAWARLHPNEWFVTNRSDENIRKNIFWIGHLYMSLTEKGLKSMLLDLKRDDWEMMPQK